jgi:NADH:ubiquinone oxidoreductase subunit 5 (subunit L)/multisubunit Na+/H+ antiporter MnhA subunit
MNYNDYMNLFYQIMKYTNFFSLIITVILIGVFIKDMYYLKPETDEKTKKATDNLGITILSFLGIWFFSGVAYFFLYYYHHIDSKAAAKKIADNLKIEQGKQSVYQLVNNLEIAEKMVNTVQVAENALMAANEVINTTEVKGTLEEKIDAFKKSQLTLQEAQIELSTQLQQAQEYILLQGKPQQEEIQLQLLRDTNAQELLSQLTQTQAQLSQLMQTQPQPLPPPNTLKNE